MSFLLRVKFGEFAQHQNMKRESKAYSYEEQLQDLELKKVSKLGWFVRSRGHKTRYSLDTCKYVLVIDLKLMNTSV